MNIFIISCFLANDAVYGIDLLKQSQSIIITGESGAGKTETTNRLIEYLCFMSDSEDEVIRKINEANPLLENFGNAKTENNWNSSRYCKFLQVILTL